MIDLKKKVISEVNIIEVVSQYVDLEKKGQNYSCICPFHNDTNPSLVVSEQKKIFKCFVCEEGGNVIDFVQKYEKIPYKKALEKLAKSKNIAIPKKSTENDKYFEVLENVKLFYNKILANSQLADEADKYLKEDRNLTPEYIKRFELGFSPLFSEALHQFLVNSNEETKNLQMQIEELKIFNEKNYDFLQGRVIFPLYNDVNELVGFSGRTMQKDNAVKYLNSKESKIFHKGSILYNFNNIVGNNTKELLIVEGYFDVITSVKKGIENVVATMGTAFNENHIKLLKKYGIQKVYLGFDSDQAGQNAILKSAKLLINNYIEVEVVSYQDSKDIDEYLNSKDITWNDIRQSAQDFSIYLAYKNMNNSDINKKAQVINEICMHLGKYTDKVKVGLLIDQIAEILKVQKDIFSTTIKNLEQRNTNSLKVPKTDLVNITAETEIKTDKLTVEEQIFYLITINKENFNFLENIMITNNFKFTTLEQDHIKLKELYDSNDEIDEVLLLDEISSYYEICNKLKKDNYIKFIKENNAELIIKDLIHPSKKQKTIKKAKIFNI